MLNGLDLFSGIGGLSLALAPWVRPVAYCENERYAQSVLLSRMYGGDLPHAAIWNDVKSLSSKYLPDVDIIYGGFPCQDISVAGPRIGLEGKRSGLYWQLHRLVKEIKPTFVFLENVPGIRTKGLREVVESLTSIGYDCRWTVVSAAELGAPHLRKRWFLLAHSNKSKLRDKSDRFTGRKDPSKSTNNGEKKQMAYSESKRLQGGEKKPFKAKAFTGFKRGGWWKSEPNVGRVVNGLPFRVDRIKALGNAVVPAQAKKAFEKLIGIYGP